MSLNITQIRSLYRRLLRELPPRPLLSTPRAPLHVHLRTSFSQLASQETPQVSARAKQTEQLIKYLSSQRNYINLLERYNPGMNMDEEERVRLSARRVGLDMPDEYKTRLDD